MYQEEPPIVVGESNQVSKSSVGGRSHKSPNSQKCLQHLNSSIDNTTITKNQKTIKKETKFTSLKNPFSFLCLLIVRCRYDGMPYTYFGRSYFICKFTYTPTKKKQKRYDDTSFD